MQSISTIGLDIAKSVSEKKGERAGSVKDACKELADRTTIDLPARYYNLSAGRLAKLYYEGRAHDKKFGPVNALAAALDGAARRAKS